MTVVARDAGERLLRVVEDLAAAVQRPEHVDQQHLTVKTGEVGLETALEEVGQRAVPRIVGGGIEREEPEQGRVGLWAGAEEAAGLEQAQAVVVLRDPECIAVGPV